MDAGPSVEGVISSPRVLCSLGISLTNGTTLPKNSISLRTPMSLPAHTQNTGKMLRVTRPLRMPSRSSSSVSVSLSKNFSINPSSFSAAASTNILFKAVAFSISSAGMSSTFGEPPSAFHEYFFMVSTSMMALKPGPVCVGY